MGYFEGEKASVILSHFNRIRNTLETPPLYTYTKRIRCVYANILSMCQKISYDFQVCIRFVYKPYTYTNHYPMVVVCIRSTLPAYTIFDSLAWQIKFIIAFT